LIFKAEINKLRIKIGQSYLQNKEVFETVHSVFGSNCDFRVDINGTGDREQLLKQIKLIKKYNVKVIEQPVMPDDPDIAYFAETVKDSGIILMADESVCSLRDAEKILKQGYYKMVNVRLSKCGGFRNALRIIDYLRRNKVAFQVGCHLGESGILSAAGRALCLMCKDALYYDGSYDKFLLKENITKEDVTFGRGGKAGPLPGNGLGVEVNIKNLKHLSGFAKTITVSRP
jgi:muconate cycloisomerase